NKSRSRFMFELLVPAEQGQLDRLGGDTKAYDLELRPRLMVQAIQQLQDAQIEPDIGKVEGLDRLEDCERVVATARRGGRDTVGCSPGPRRGRQEGARLAGGGRRSPGIHRLRRGPDGVLGSARCLAGEEDDARGGRGGGRAALQGVRGPLRHGPGGRDGKDGVTAMQLGMIGLGRMGANMTRRLMRGGHEVGVYAPTAKTRDAFAKETGAVAASSL